MARPIRLDRRSDPPSTLCLIITRNSWTRRFRCPYRNLTPCESTFLYLAVGSTEDKQLKGSSSCFPFMLSLGLSGFIPKTINRRVSRCPYSSELLCRPPWVYRTWRLSLPGLPASDAHLWCISPSPSLTASCVRGMSSGHVFRVFHDTDLWTLTRGLVA